MFEKKITRFTLIKNYNGLKQKKKFRIDLQQFSIHIHYWYWETPIYSRIFLYLPKCPTSAVWEVISSTYRFFLAIRDSPSTFGKIKKNYGHSGKLRKTRDISEFFPYLYLPWLTCQKDNMHPSMDGGFWMPPRPSVLPPISTSNRELAFGMASVYTASHQVIPFPAFKSISLYLHA